MKVRLPTISDLEKDGTTKRAHCVAQAGRPKKRRFRGRAESELLGLEPISKRKCKSCGGLGHFEKNCAHKTY